MLLSAGRVRSGESFKRNLELLSFDLYYRFGKQRNQKIWIANGFRSNKLPQKKHKRPWGIAEHCLGKQCSIIELLCPMFLVNNVLCSMFSKQWLAVASSRLTKSDDCIPLIHFEHFASLRHFILWPPEASKDLALIPFMDHILRNSDLQVTWTKSEHSKNGPNHFLVTQIV